MGSRTRQAVSQPMITKQQIIDEARTWLDTPFAHQGRAKGVGADCACTAAIGPAQALGLSEFDTTDYSRLPDPSKMRAYLDAHMDRIPVNEAGPGDIYWMAFNGNPQHLALITDKGILHSYAQAKKCVEHSLDDTWRKRVRAAYRFRGVE